MVENPLKTKEASESKHVAIFADHVVDSKASGTVKMMIFQLANPLNISTSGTPIDLNGLFNGKPTGSIHNCFPKRVRDYQPLLLISGQDS